MKDKTYNGFEMLKTLEEVQRIVGRHRPWHAREQIQTEFRMHPAVYAAVAVCHPEAYGGLVLEWPHVADDDPKQIAYTRDERMGEANRQVMTSIGKYLRRHFPTMSDHVLRDIVALHTPNKIEFKFLHTLDEMVHAIDNGPYSCMCSRYHDSDPDTSPYWTRPHSRTEGHHPYEIYDPALGWHMAVVMEGKAVTGRALCLGNTFVRSYKFVSDRNSSTDERLDAWLKSQGYTKDCSWDYGTEFKHIPLTRTNRYFVAPYIDGNHHDVMVVEEDKLVLVDANDMNSGEHYYTCRNTCGTPDCNEAGNRVYCEDCEERVDEDDIRYVGEYADRCVCEDCRSNNYTYAYTRRGGEEYIPDDRVVYVGREYYDTDYLSDNGIVELADGDYVHQDDAVCVDGIDEWHRLEDCVQLHDGEWCLEADAWQCEHDREWYPNSDEGIRYETECGKTVHIKHADAYAPETTEGE